MAIPSQTVLWDNALVRSKKIDEFHCSACEDDRSFAAWQEHISDTTHIATLQQFNSIFERRDTKVYCRLCDEDFDWNVIKSHGKSHSIVPWHQFDDKYRQFFENRIILCKQKFYCCLCDASFSNCSDTIVHIDKQTHRNLKESAASLTQFSDSARTGKMYVFLVSEGFILDNVTRLQCKFCKDDGIEFKETTKHINGFFHQYFKSKFASTLNKMFVEPDTTVVSESPRSIESTESPNQRLLHCYFEKTDKYFIRCNLCNFFFLAMEEKTDFHVTGKIHTDSLKKYGCENISLREDEIYYCKCCDVSIPDRKNLHLHVKEKNHTVSMLRSNKLQSATLSEGADKTKIAATTTQVSKIVLQNVPCTYIVKLNATDSYCKVCEMKLSDATAIENHAAGSSHAAALEKYGCDNITLKEGNIYWCKCCKCQLPGRATVYLHIKGRRHSFSLTNIKSQQQNQPKETNVAEAKPEPPEWRKALSLMMNSLSKLSEKNRPSRPLADQPVKNVVEEILCSFCSVVVTSSVELHSHMASHFTVEFVHTRVNKNLSNGRSTHSGKIRVEEKNVTVSSKNTVLENLVAFKGKNVLHKAIEDRLPSDRTNTDSSKNIKSTNVFSSKPTRINLGNTIKSDDEDANSGTDFSENRQQPKKTIMQKIVKLLDFDKDYIYNMKDKLKDIELGMKMCIVVDAQNIYCLICQKTVANTLQNYFEHLCSLDHNAYLEGMMRDHKLFELAPGQLSDLDLAYQYMDEISEEWLRCFICDEEVTNTDYALQAHVENENHEIIRDEMHVAAKENLENIRKRMQCDWYNVQKYWCVPCSANFENELNFVKHLESKKHAMVTTSRDNIDRTMMYDFCAPCALLWYGYRCTYAYHCDVPAHKWLLRDGHYSLPGLPELAKNLLATPEQFVEDTIHYLESVATQERDRGRSLIQDLENAVKGKFFEAKAYVFGSRAAGLASPESDVHVFLDCGNRYDGKIKSKRVVLNLMTDVHQCLMRDSQSWDINELLTDCQSPIIRANHRATGLSCEISVENGLSVENTKLVKTFTQIFPQCRNLILFLKQWLMFCNLSGSECISSYALYWYVIFYLQKESILPSIATLIARNKKSHVISDCEVGVSHEFSYNDAEGNYSLKEFLIRFFTFYANFDFRYDVACPLLGEVLKKRAFVDHRRLPKEMTSYVAYIENSVDPEPLRIDSPMCLQDPFDLQHNITSAVNRVFLCRFRTYCSKSLDLLCS